MKINFNIATYNLWKNCGKFPKRIHKMGDKLNHIDCICLQEDYEDRQFSSSNTINKTLNFNKITLPLRLKKRAGEKSSSNLTILSKYEIKLLENICFNENEEDERGAQMVQLEVDHKKIIVVNTHLSNLSHLGRMNQIEVIKYKLENYQSDLLMICGDMNSNENSKEIKRIKRCGYNSVNKQATYEEENLMLDYIFYKNSFEVEVSSKITIKELSDHYCLENNFCWSH
ncbi:MAG: endonuclease/exonuclease/phosphatase family protein [Candidatus Marinarcus sp.]|uniref:endonuclease/exonuclease/phosphatase family protein n=1 Tax=Candidatus Marinarcus sp. TaxID=3100987 RepID=UPI003B0100AB